MTTSSRQVLFTREQFEAFILHQRVKIYVAAYEIRPCACGDVNCHGWRLAPAVTLNDVTESGRSPLRRFP